MVEMYVPWDAVLMKWSQRVEPGLRCGMFLPRSGKSDTLLDQLGASDLTHKQLVCRYAWMLLQLVATLPTFRCEPSPTVTNTISVPCKAFSMAALLSLAALYKISVVSVNPYVDKRTGLKRATNLETTQLLTTQLETTGNTQAYCSNLWVATSAQASGQFLTNL